MYVVIAVGLLNLKAFFVEVVKCLVLNSTPQKALT